MTQAAKDCHCRVEYHEKLEADYYRLGLQTQYQGFVPGQFGMLAVPNSHGILLRRPFSFARQVAKTTEIIYKVVGQGTTALSNVAVGDFLSLLGPLGSGFTLPSLPSKSPRPLVAVAGGYGVAPFLEMAAQLQQQGQSLWLFYGARSKKDLICLDLFEKLQVKLFLSTEDGSLGFKGRIPELLQREFSSSRLPEQVWSCGPMGLLKAVQQWCLQASVPAQVSVEETMGCGTGVCLGCVVQSANGHWVRACVEGPVFAVEDLGLG